MSTPAPVPDPTVAQATTVISGLYTALAQRNPTLRDTYIVPTVKPKLTTDVVDTLSASTAVVSDVQAVPAPELGPGTAKFSAIVTFTQDDGDKQVERDWFVVENTPTGAKVVDTGQDQILSAMPADPTPTPTPEQGAGDSICQQQCTTSGCVQYQYYKCGGANSGSNQNNGGGQPQTGMCHFNEGAGAIVPCDSPSCQAGFIGPGIAGACTPASFLNQRPRFPGAGTVADV